MFQFYRLSFQVGWAQDTPTGTPCYNERRCGGVICYVSFVVGPYSFYLIVKWGVKWNCGKENPFVARVVRYKGLHYNRVYLKVAGTLVHIRTR